MISPDDFVRALKRRRYLFYTGVPCSFFQAAINRVIDDSELRYVIAPNEGSALALAAGSFLAGSPAVVMIQNSGLGNLVNPLTSLSAIYRLPALVFVSGRGYGVSDEPQHEIMGGAAPAVLDAVGARYSDMPADLPAFENALDDAASYLWKEKRPYFFFVRKDTIESCRAARPAAPPSYPMTRIEAIRIIAQTFSERELVVATTGMPSRELFAVSDRPQNFYMQGSMGHAPSIALGLAIDRPSLKVVVLDGDGALLMHMGGLSMVGHYRPENYYHLLLDNEAYETTGSQKTTSATTDFVKASLACGYRMAAEVTEASDLARVLSRMLQSPGPAFLRIKVNTEAAEGIPRISSKYDSVRIAERFREGLTEPQRVP